MFHMIVDYIGSQVAVMQGAVHTLLKNLWLQFQLEWNMTQYLHFSEKIGSFHNLD